MGNKCLRSQGLVFVLLVNVLYVRLETLLKIYSLSKCINGFRKRLRATKQNVREHPCDGLASLVQRGVL